MSTNSDSESGNSSDSGSNNGSLSQRRTSSNQTLKKPLSLSTRSRRAVKQKHRKNTNRLSDSDNDNSSDDSTNFTNLSMRQNENENEDSDSDSSSSTSEIEVLNAETKRHKRRLKTLTKSEIPKKKLKTDRPYMNGDKFSNAMSLLQEAMKEQCEQTIDWKSKFQMERACKLSLMQQINEMQKEKNVFQQNLANTQIQNENLKKYNALQKSVNENLQNSVQSLQKRNDRYKLGNDKLNQELNDANAGLKKLERIRSIFNE